MGVQHTGQRATAGRYAVRLRPYPKILEPQKNLRIEIDFRLDQLPVDIMEHSGKEGGLV